MILTSVKILTAVGSKKIREATTSLLFVCSIMCHIPTWLEGVAKRYALCMDRLMVSQNVTPFIGID